jgi:hypothetical protein
MLHVTAIKPMGTRARYHPGVTSVALNGTSAFTCCRTSSTTILLASPNEDIATSATAIQGEPLGHAGSDLGRYITATPERALWGCPLIPLNVWVLPFYF